MTWVAVGVGGVSMIGSVAGSAMNGGKKGSRQSRGSERISQQQVDIANRQVRLGEEQAAITEPLRRKTASTLEGFLQSGQTPSFLDLNATVSPLAALGMPEIASQQQGQRTQLMAQGSRGGLLQQQLAQAALQGGVQRSGLQQQDLLRQEQRDTDRSGIRRTLFGAAGDAGTGGLALAFQGLNSGMGGMGQAAQNMNVLGAQRIQENMAFQSGMGQLAGQAGNSLANRYMPAYGEGSLGGQKMGAQRR